MPGVTKDAAVSDSVCRADGPVNQNPGDLFVRRSEPAGVALLPPVASGIVVGGGRHPVARPRANPVAAASPANTPAVAGDAAITAGFSAQTQAAILKVKSRHYVADIMVAHSPTEAVNAFSAMIAQSPDLKDAARRNGITDTQLAQMLGTTAYRHGVQGSPNEMVLGIPRDPVFFSQLVMRRMHAHGTEGALAGQAASTLATHDIDFRVSHGETRAAATQGFAAAAAAGWQELRREDPNAYPAFDRTAANEVNRLVVNGYRSSASFDRSAYNPSDSNDYFEDYDFDSPPLEDPAGAPEVAGINAGAQTIAGDRRRSDARMERFADARDAAREREADRASGDSRYAAVTQDDLGMRMRALRQGNTQPFAARARRDLGIA